MFRRYMKNKQNDFNLKVRNVEKRSTITEFTTMQKDTIIKSTKWSVITEMITKLAAPITNMVLARLLMPEVFGLVATFSLVTSFAELFTDAGFQKYIVQHEFEDQKDFDLSVNVAFWTNFLFSCLIWLGICVFRDNIAIFVGSEGYGIHIAVLSVQIPLYAFSSIHLSIYKRQFKFKELLPIRLIDSIVPFLITIPLAYFLKNSWAIIIGNLSRQMINAFLLSKKSTWKPSFVYSFVKLKNMWKTCTWMLMDSIMIWTTSYAGTLVVSYFLDSHYLGLYRTGITTITPYINLMYAMTAPVLFSALSRLQSNLNDCNACFLSYQKAAALIVFPLGMAVYVFSDAVTMILLGSKWMEISSLIGSVGLGLSFCAITAQYNSDYFRALGKPKVAFCVQGIYAVIMVPSLLLAVKHSFSMLCIVTGVLNVVYSFISITAMHIIFRLNITKYVKNMTSAIIGCIGFGLVAEVLLKMHDNSLVYQIFVGLIAVCVYISILLIIPESRKIMLSFLRSINILKK